MSSIPTDTPDDPTWSQKEFKCLALPNETIITGHSYAKFEHAIGNIVKDRMKHISKDIEALTADLPDNIFVRYAEGRPDFMKVLIADTEGTPYAYGLFEFDLYCPHDYPVVPPNLTFCTTGGNSFNFNPNLYADGFVCLSVIGTWGRSTWESNNGTILGVLPILQACVLGEEPFCNEPGLENYKGLQPSLHYNRKLHGNTVKLAMLDWLQRKKYGLPPQTQGTNIPKSNASSNGAIAEYLSDNEGDQTEPIKASIWDEVIKRHFTANKKEFMKTIKEWIADRAPKTSNDERKSKYPASHTNPDKNLGLLPDDGPNFAHNYPGLKLAHTSHPKSGNGSTSSKKSLGGGHKAIPAKKQSSPRSVTAKPLMLQPSPQVKHGVHSAGLSAPKPGKHPAISKPSFGKSPAFPTSGQPTGEKAVILKLALQTPPSLIGTLPDSSGFLSFARHASILETTMKREVDLVDEALREFVGELKEAVVALSDAERIRPLGFTSRYEEDEDEYDDEDEDEDDDEDGGDGDDEKDADYEDYEDEAQDEAKDEV